MAAQSFDSIVEAIIGALGYLKARRDAQGLWEDAANSVDGATASGSGDIMACEGVLSFLLALNCLNGRPDLQQRIDTIFPRAALEGEMFGLLERLRQGGTYGGRPYAWIVDESGAEHPLVDVVCYAISIITLGEKIFGPPADAERRQLGREVMETCLEILAGSVVYDEVRRAKGWSFTNYDLPDRPFKYCTWMACDTLSDLIEIKDLSDRYYASTRVLDAATAFRRQLPQVKAEMARIHVDGQHTAAERGAFQGRNVLITTGAAVQEDEADRGYSYNLWIIMSLMYLSYEDPRVLATALSAMGTKLGNSKARADQIKAESTILFETGKAFMANMDAGRNFLDDRSFLPQYVKALALFRLWYPAESAGVEAQLEMALGWLMDNRKAGCPAWDKHARQGDHALYQTERAIEALCRVADYLRVGAEVAAPSNAAPVLPSDGMVLGSAFAAELARIVAEVASQHAVSLEINGERAKVVIERAVGQRLDAMEDAIHARLAQRLSGPLDGIVAALGSLADRLSQADSGQASIQGINSTKDDILALMKEMAGITQG